MLPILRSRVRSFEARLLAGNGRTGMPTYYCFRCSSCPVEGRNIASFEEAHKLANQHKRFCGGDGEMEIYPEPI